jgi:hypothetical protein
MTTRRNYGAWILFTTVLSTSSACATGARLTSGGGTAPAAERAVVVNVTNHYNGPVEIYAAGSGTSYRMGTVLPGFASQFVLRQAMIANGPVELLAYAGRGAQVVRSDRLLLAPGAVVNFEIATQLLLSTATVRP